MKILRVFPRKTTMTPDDEEVRIGLPGMFDQADQIDISVIFTEDLPKAEKLLQEWRYVSSNVNIGGPATKMKGEEFISGKYLKKGNVITSRGCPNRCWFCSVPEREGNNVREYPVQEGYNILDDNLLACSDNHIKAVFEMLSRQVEKPRFSGGLEAKRLKSWHCAEFKKLRPKTMYFAYDTPDDREPLEVAGRMLQKYGFTNDYMMCYVLIGYKNDSIAKAEARLIDAYKFGFMPFAMLWNENKDHTWKRFQSAWCIPVSVKAFMRKHGESK